MNKLADRQLDRGPVKAPKPKPASKPAPANTDAPARYTYALPAYTAEIRSDGWYVAKTMPGFTGQKPTWSGPFETIETACLSIGRHLAVEIADRHTRIVEAHKIRPASPLFGLKKTTHLKQR